MPLTKKEFATLTDILSRINKAEKYILCEDIHIFSDKYKCEIKKEIGSELSYLFSAKTLLNSFLNPETES